MTDTLHGRLRRQLEECFEDPAGLPESIQTFVALVDEAYQEAGLDLHRGESGSDQASPSSGTGSVAAQHATTAVAERPMIELETLPDVVFSIAEDGTILDCRGGDSKDLTIPRPLLIGKRITRCPFGDIGPQFTTAIRLARPGRKPISVEYTLPCDNGLAHFEACVARSAGGQLLAVVRNTTAQAEARSIVRQGEREYRELLNAAPVALAVVDPATNLVIECNQAAGAFYRGSPTDLVGSSLLDSFVDAAHVPDLQAIAESGVSQTIESWVRSHDDRAALVEMILSRVIFRGQHAILAMHRELDATPVDRPEVINSISMLKATFDATADGILVVDPSGNLVTCNRLFAEMWGIPMDLLQPGREQEAAGIALSQLENPGTLVEELIAIHASAEVRCSKIVGLLDGRFFECVSMSQLIAGEKAGRVWSFRDVTDRMKTEERIRHHAYHDSLTGLPNRTLFHDRLAQDLGHSRRAGTNSALLLLDLDRFKTINDTLGHAAGDKLLIEVAKRLESRRRDGDTIARLGGDEFVLIVSQLRRKEDAAVVAEQVLEVLEPPIQIAEHELHISASIGIAIFPDDGDDATTLMKSADVALYRAKELGRNNFQIYEPKLSQRAMERLIMEKDLRQAIHDHEFILQYQPQYELKTGRIRGVEALIRWKQGGSVVPPDKFIPIAEECGLVVPLGRWVLEESARMCVEFNKHAREPLRICVNVSALQIQRPNFANEVSQIMRDAGMPLKHLVLELTESALMQNPEQGSWAMAQLEGMGVGIAMDDFGTGHSSLSHVSHLPISMIKIDRAFVTNCAKRKTDATILSAIVTMGQALDMKVLAEGVETEAQAKVLLRLGCDEVQGYLYSRPIHAEEIIDLLRGKR